MSAQTQTTQASRPGPIARLGEALRFLTIIPVPWAPPAGAEGFAVALPLFPAAGLVIGAMLVAAGWMAGLAWAQPAPAALVVVAWGVITSGLHLDGLSDTFDGVMSWRPREHKLEGEVEAIIVAARARDLHLVAVTGEVGLGLVPEHPLGRAYRDLLGLANQRLAAAADEVYLVVAGLPVELAALAAPWAREVAP